MKAKRCNGCHRLHYCSRECQKEHWIAVHKTQCSALRSTIGKYTILLLRSLTEVDAVSHTMDEDFFSWVMRRAFELRIRNFVHGRYGTDHPLALTEFTLDYSNLPFRSTYRVLKDVPFTKSELVDAPQGSLGWDSMDRFQMVVYRRCGNMVLKTALKATDPAVRLPPPLKGTELECNTAM
jgi:hypothetical protein